MTLSAVWWVAGLALLGLWLAAQARINQKARMAADRHAQQHGLQLLDQNVVLAGVRLRRGLGLERTYRFEFSHRGDRRQRGYVIMRGGHVVRVFTDPIPE